jgi:hypothetical protein
MYFLFLLVEVISRRDTLPAFTIHPQSSRCIRGYYQAVLKTSNNTSANAW